MIDIQPRDDLEHRLWRAALELADLQPEGWTLVGAQMVMLHAWEHGVSPTRTSRDLDVLVNIKAIAGGTQQFARQLLDAGFELAMVTPDGRGHRFVRGDVTMDVLAADNLGDRADLTTIPPARTIAVPGGSQALRRTELVDVSLPGQDGRLPRPNVLGAILLKARAADVDPDPERHLADLAFLLSLVDDPFELVGELTPKEQRYLGARGAVRDPNHPAWGTVANPERGIATLSVLTGAGQ
ncbi:MAG: hypothetical protein H0U13_08615 [Gemmatimonadaceae bacterium]|nr:hypothetical protein [Gemmatimonadaceae bacterium]